MRYGICVAMAASPMPPLPRRVISSPDFAPLIATPRLSHDLAGTLASATLGAIPVAAVASCADDHPGPATCAGEHSMAVHEGRLPSGTGQGHPRCATLRRADVAGNRGVC